MSDRGLHVLPSSLTGKRVCFLSPAAYPLLDPSVGGGWSGGAETQFVTIGRALARIGLDVHFVVGDHGQPANVVIHGVTAHRTTFRYLGGSKRSLAPDWWRLIKLLRSIRADYHLLKVPPHLLFPLGLYCRTHGGKLVFVGQKDSDLDERLVRKRDGTAAWWMYRMGLAMADAVVAQTASQQAGFHDIFGKEAMIVRNVLTLGADDATDKEDYVLWVGSDSKDKQPDLVPELARLVPEVRFRMIMSRSPSSSDDSFMRRECRGIANLEYLGTVPFDMIAEHYKGARLFISTSRCEGFPNTFLQAWQYRTPVVTLQVDPDGVIARHGLGRRSGNLEKMARDIRDLYGDTTLCEKLGDNAHQYAYEYHSLDAAVQGYCTMLATLE